MKKPIYVTQPYLPPLEEFNEYLLQIWDNKLLTNNGPLHNQLEEELARYLGVKYVSLFANGTLALVTALQALQITGEVITTPYSFVATTHALWWNNIKPVFSDIEPASCNLDPVLIESAITPQTSAILPVHVYGNPCDVEAIKQIADKHNLRVIYDAAHAFGVKINGNSVLNYGDLSILSFHATKVFHTFEGGAIISHDADTKRRIDDLKNFGFRGETTVTGPGINAKMNELQAAMGLLQLKYIDSNIEKRRSIVQVYRELLKDIRGISLLDDTPGVKHSHSYFPVFINESQFGLSRDDTYEMLKKSQIFGRRYFYPLISSFSPYKELPSAGINNVPVANKLSGEVICLPLHAEINNSAVHYISEAIRNLQNTEF